MMSQEKRRAPRFELALPAGTPPGAGATVDTPTPGVAPPPPEPATDSGDTARAVPGRAPISPSAHAWRLRTCTGLGAVRKALGLSAALFAMSCVALFALPLLRPEAYRGLFLVRWLHEAVDPLLALTTGLSNINLTYQNFNFLLIGLPLLTFVVAQVVIGRLQGLDSWIRKPLPRPAVAGVPLVSHVLREADRRALARARYTAIDRTCNLNCAVFRPRSHRF